MTPPFGGLNYEKGGSVFGADPGPFSMPISKSEDFGFIAVIGIILIMCMIILQPAVGKGPNYFCGITNGAIYRQTLMPAMILFSTILFEK